MSDRSLRTVAVGDIHGELDALQEILRHAGMIDDGNRWVAGSDTLVQTGDMVDRGPKSVEAHEFLAELQEMAAKGGGQVVRLVGNHELLLLSGNFALADHYDPVELAAKIRMEVLFGRMRGAFAQQAYLFTHGGLRSRIRRHLLGTGNAASSVHTTEILAERISQVLVRAVRGKDFSDPCFSYGHEPWAELGIAGTYWTYFSEELIDSADADAVRQVVGHTIQPHIAQNESGRIFCIDVGIHRDGKRAYLEIRDGEARPGGPDGAATGGGPWRRNGGNGRR